MIRPKTLLFASDGVGSRLLARIRGDDLLPVHFPAIVTIWPVRIVLETWRFHHFILAGPEHFKQPNVLPMALQTGHNSRLAFVATRVFLSSLRIACLNAGMSSVTRLPNVSGIRGGCGGCATTISAHVHFSTALPHFPQSVTGVMQGTWMARNVERHLSALATNLAVPTSTALGIRAL